MAAYDFDDMHGDRVPIIPDDIHIMASDLYSRYIQQYDYQDMFMENAYGRLVPRVPRPVPHAIVLLPENLEEFQRVYGHTLEMANEEFRFTEDEYWRTKEVAKYFWLHNFPVKYFLGFLRDSDGNIWTRKRYSRGGPDDMPDSKRVRRNPYVGGAAGGALGGRKRRRSKSKRPLSKSKPRRRGSKVRRRASKSKLRRRVIYKSS